MLVLMSPGRGSSSRPRGFGAVAAAVMRSATDSLRRAGSKIAPRQSRSAPAADSDVVQVSYRPRRDGHADPGEVVWAWIPYEDDPSQGKDRPAVAIGFAGPLLALVPFTSQDQHGRRDTYEIGVGGWDASGRPSWVKLDRMVGVNPASVRREGSTLEPARFKDLIARLQAVHGSQLRLTR